MREKIEEKLLPIHTLIYLETYNFIDILQLDVLYNTKPVISGKVNVKSYLEDERYEYDISLKLGKKIIKVFNDESKISKKIKSIHLITKGVVADGDIFVVIDEMYKQPIRFDGKTNKQNSTIKTLYKIIYSYSKEGITYENIVKYDIRLARNINNELFKRKVIKEYMKTNNINKPTLVHKSEDYLVPNGEVFMDTILINKVPSQHRHLYKVIQ